MASLVDSIYGLSISTTTNASTPTLSLTSEELRACKNVRSSLIESGLNEKAIDPRLLSITTINQKLRVTDGVDKYRKFMESLAIFDIKNFEEDVWNNLNDFDDVIRPLLKSYSVCGTHKNRAIFWINGSSPVTVEQERNAVRQARCGLQEGGGADHCADRGLRAFDCRHEADPARAWRYDSSLG